MADWKQITARIRRARTGKDPVGQLSNLFEKTRDAMVAFELARYFETSGQNPEAAKWYVAAAQRFRRADWKTKAQEAAVRLGAEIVPGDSASPLGDSLSAPPSVPASAPSGEEPLSAVDSENDSVASAPTQDSAKPDAESAETPARKRAAGAVEVAATAEKAQRLSLLRPRRLPRAPKLLLLRRVSRPARSIIMRNQSLLA